MSKSFYLSPYYAENFLKQKKKFSVKTSLIGTKEVVKKIINTMDRKNQIKPLNILDHVRMAD